MADEAPLADAAEDVELVSSEVVFDGAVWDVRRDVFRYDGRDVRREYVAHTGAVAVLALDEHDRALLIRQYRHPIRARDWEIPAGLLDVAGEPPLASAKRELAEEADLTASDWAVLADFHSTPGGSDEGIRVYLARGLSATEAAFERIEEEAGIETRLAPLDELVEAVRSGRVRNAILQVAALHAAVARAAGWSGLRPADEPWPDAGRRG